MQIKLTDKTELQQYLHKIKQQAESTALFCTKYIDLGLKTVRVLCYSPEFLPLMQKQLTFTLKDHSDNYDDTLVIWKQQDTHNFITSLGDRFDPRKNMRLRLEMVAYKVKSLNVAIMDETYSHHNPVISIDSFHGLIEAVDTETNTYYYGVENLEPEEFIKQGHIFVQLLNNIVKTPTANIVHGAVVGTNNNGVLFCARGQRGKSTLTVLSMMKGFEYVSDDYLTLEQKGEGLYASPIYSIITLSPRMYNELYDELKGKFVSNNARKDKYVINIEGYHNQFKVNYPIKLCIFPEIVSDKEPSIVPCSAEDKGRAIVQLIQSTVSQMRDLNNRAVIKKIFDMVKDKEFYKFHLCNNIQRNTEFLREFLQNLQLDGTGNSATEKVMTDITFDLANILDSENHTIYSLNKFATNLLENLQNGVSAEQIATALQQIKGKNPKIDEQFNGFVQVLNTKGFIKPSGITQGLNINWEFAKENNYKLSVLEYAETATNELVK